MTEIKSSFSLQPDGIFAELLDIGCRSCCEKEPKNPSFQRELLVNRGFIKPEEKPIIDAFLKICFSCSEDPERADISNLYSCLYRAGWNSDWLKTSTLKVETP
jgi:hypothetical protein